MDLNALPETEIPVELWTEILYYVMMDDIRQENNNDTYNSRLVCRTWMAVIDADSSPKALVPTWNPYFDNRQMLGEGLVGFPRSMGTHFSTRVEVEAFLERWGAEDPLPNPFLKETLIVEWRSNVEYTQILDLLPIVFERFGSYILHLKICLDSRMSQSLECVLLAARLENLTSLAIFFVEPIGHLLLDHFWTDLNINQRVREGALKHLTELHVLDCAQNNSVTSRRLFRIFGMAGGKNVKSLRFWTCKAHRTISNLGLFPNVTTLKLCHMGESEINGSQGDTQVDRDIVLGLLRNFGEFKWKIQRLSIKVFRRNITNRCLYYMLMLAHGLNETLHEFYLDFGKMDTRLESGTPIPIVFQARLGEKPFNLVLLSLPYFITEHLPVLRELTAICGNLEHLKLVQQEGYLKDDNEVLRRREVLEAVPRVWDVLPTTVECISVKFRKLTRDTTNRRILTNVVWKYERPIQL